MEPATEPAATQAAQIIDPSGRRTSGKFAGVLNKGLTGEQILSPIAFVTKASSCGILRSTIGLR